MRKIIFTMTLLLAFAMAGPSWAVQEHHPADGSQAATPMTQEQMGTSITKMQEAREKMDTAKTPSERQNLMHQHMEQMKEAMKTMNMMSGQVMMTGDQKGMMNGADTQNMPMGERMTRMEKKMDMMENMMGQSGMMSGQGMMMQNCMMGNRLEMMEKRMQMMQEMMKGMMAQQEMMMKK